jgi:hypothetical protein
MPVDMRGGGVGSAVRSEDWEFIKTTYRVTGATAAACWRTPSQTRPGVGAKPSNPALLMKRL